MQDHLELAAWLADVHIVTMQLILPLPAVVPMLLRVTYIRCGLPSSDRCALYQYVVILVSSCDPQGWVIVLSCTYLPIVRSWYLISHDGLVPLSTRDPSLFQGLLRRSTDCLLTTYVLIGYLLSQTFHNVPLLLAMVLGSRYLCHRVFFITTG